MITAMIRVVNSETKFPATLHMRTVNNPEMGDQLSLIVNNSFFTEELLMANHVTVMLAGRLFYCRVASVHPRSNEAQVIVYTMDKFDAVDVEARDVTPHAYLGCTTDLTAIDRADN